MKTKLIKNAKVIDVEAGIVRPDLQISIRDGRIEEVASPVHGRFTEVIDAGEFYVCPGLIDTHVHLFLDAGENPRITFLEGDAESRLRTARANAQRAVSAGITTLRDCGGPAELVWPLQRSVERGDIHGPRILACGSPLVSPGGHCHFFGIELRSAADVAGAIEKQVGQGASFVKLIASGGGLTPGTRPQEADLPLPLMREATRVARAHGVYVAAHCHATESIVRALDAGVDTIEHAGFVSASGYPRFDAEIATRLKAEGTIVVPTVISAVRMASALRRQAVNDSQTRRSMARFAARSEHVARFLESGVRIAAGTDCGVSNTPFDSLADELSTYVKAGMTPAGALRSATSEAARYLRQPALGAIQPGYAADLLFLEANPLLDLKALRMPAAVFKGGEMVAGSTAPSVEYREIRVLSRSLRSSAG